MNFCLPPPFLTREVLTKVLFNDDVEDKNSPKTKLASQDALRTFIQTQGQALHTISVTILSVMGMGVGRILARARSVQAPALDELMSLMGSQHGHIRASWCGFQRSKVCMF